MLRHLPTPVRIALILLGLLSRTTAPVAAQVPEEGRRETTIYIALPDVFPDIEAHALVVRDGRRDIVVLRTTDATPEALVTALSVLRRARARRPEPTKGELMPIVGFHYPEGLDARTRLRMERLLERLRSRPVTDVGSLGPGRWMPYAGR